MTYVDTHARYEFPLGRLLYESVALGAGGVFLAVLAVRSISTAPLSAAVIAVVARLHLAIC